MEGIEIEWKHEVKFQGVTQDCKLLWESYLFLFYNFTLPLMYVNLKIFFLIAFH